MTMAYAANHSLAGLYAGTKDASAGYAGAAYSRTGDGILARIGTAIMESRRRAAEREIARHRHLVERMRGIEFPASGLPFTSD
jgi:hypothetical protein